MAKPLALVCVLVFIAGSPACSFCGGNPAGRSTLREDLQQTSCVAFGSIKNPRLGDDPSTGTCEFHVGRMLKGEAPKHAILLPRYIPEAADVVAFFALRGNALDAVRVQASNPALAAYLAATAKLDPVDVPARLAHAFANLDAADPTVSDDAFLEFAKASDADIALAKARLDPAKLKRMLADPRTPAARVGVYGLLLGLCGGKADAPTLAAVVVTPPTGSMAGCLTGLALLDADTGWEAIAATLGDGRRDYGDRLAARSAVHYLKANGPADGRPRMLGLYKSLLADPDIADLAIEDLRTWKYWDLTADVVALYGRPRFTAKVMRNAVLRYALSCPDAAAKAFLTAARDRDPKAVAEVEERMKAVE